MTGFSGYERLELPTRLEQRGKDFMAIFVSGSNINPNPKLYKYYWWIYSMESYENSAAEVFIQKLID